MGGEYGTSATYMSEVATHRHRGFFASFQYVTLIGGQLLAVLVLVIMQQFLSNAELKAWGWRIPFAIGALAAVVAFFLRRSLAETTSADVRHREHAGTIKGVFRYPRSFFTVLGFTAGGSLIFYEVLNILEDSDFRARRAGHRITGLLHCTNTDSRGELALWQGKVAALQHSRMRYDHIRARFYCSMQRSPALAMSSSSSCGGAAVVAARA